MYRRAPLLALAVLPLLASAAETPSVTGVYSNITRTLSEDVVGMEVTVSITDTGYYAVLQCAEGADATRPVVVPVSLDHVRDELVFSAHDDADNSCPMVPFTGKVSAAGLRLVYPEGEAVGLLKRGGSFWQ